MKLLRESEILGRFRAIRHEMDRGDMRRGTKTLNATVANGDDGDATLHVLVVPGLAQCELLFAHDQAAHRSLRGEEYWFQSQAMRDSIIPFLAPNDTAATFCVSTAEGASFRVELTEGDNSVGTLKLKLAARASCEVPGIFPSGQRDSSEGPANCAGGDGGSFLAASRSCSKHQSCVYLSKIVRFGQNTSHQ